MIIRAISWRALSVYCWYDGLVLTTELEMHSRSFYHT